MFFSCFEHLVEKKGRHERTINFLYLVMHYYLFALFFPSFAMYLKGHNQFEVGRKRDRRVRKYHSCCLKSQMNEEKREQKSNCSFESTARVLSSYETTEKAGLDAQILIIISSLEVIVYEKRSMHDERNMIENSFLFFRGEHIMNTRDKPNNALSCLSSSRCVYLLHCFFCIVWRQMTVSRSFFYSLPPFFLTMTVMTIKDKCTRGS